MQADNVTKLITGFYDMHPFPGFEVNQYNKKTDIYHSANIYGKLLADQLPENCSIIDFGCGTGRHCLLLGVNNRQILGIDMSDNSLAIANELKEKLNFTNVRFEKQDIFNLNISYEADVIMSIGVLHHTYSIEKAFEKINKHVKPGGYVIIGLYNTYGRLLTKILQLANKITFNMIEKHDYYNNNIAKGDFEKDMWRYDMYRCPHELTMSIGGVLKMFKKNNIEFLNAFPNKFALGQDVFPRDCENLFKSSKPGTILEHALIQLKWIFTEYKAGGLFMVIGKKSL